MLLPIFVRVGLADMAISIVPHDFVGVFLAAGSDDGLEYVAPFGQGHFIENVVNIGIALANTFQFLAVQIDAGRAEVRVNGNGSLLALALRVAALKESLRVLRSKVMRPFMLRASTPPRFHMGTAKSNIFHR